MLRTTSAWMRWSALLLTPLLGLSSLRAVAADGPPLVLEATIPLENTSGRIDHMAFDLRRQRLYVAELGNGTVDVVDLAARKVVGRVGGLKEPQGVGYSEKADLLVVASAGDGSVRFYRGQDLAPSGIIQLGDDADNVRIDTRNGNVVVATATAALQSSTPWPVPKSRMLPCPAIPRASSSIRPANVRS